ncbi:MAG: homocysteine S-methyltransferase family protein [Lachnospiraceae bacterium]|nr:homocysteine S-methyltransferase family protein [Lachnospiraceae bacterium]
MDFLQKLKEGRIFNDGAFGTDLQKKGIRPGELPETWNLTHEEIIIGHHKEFFEAGADIATTNTFGANRLRFPENLKEIVEKGVALAIEGRKRAGREKDGFVALDLGPTGKLIEPLGDLPFAEAADLFRETASIGEAAGADLILIETMNDLVELRAAVLGAKQGTRLPVCATLTFNEKGKLLTGGTIESTAVLLEGLGVSALGFNCGTGPALMKENVKRLLAASDLPVMVCPNAGLPKVRDGKTVYDVGPEDFASEMEEIAELGARILGGCCGTTTEHIGEMIKTVRPLPLKEREGKKRTLISSATRVVELGKAPVLIGERINPTGKKRFQEALRNKDFEYILAQASAQAEAGAQVLDVNVGLPEIDEPAMMEEVVRRLQDVTDLPLQLDTGDPEALERGLFAYHGKALINSVSGEQERLDSILPLVKKYGGVVVGLALDENGIPETAEGRVLIAEKIYAAAEHYGIPREDVVIDGLAMTVSSDPRAALVTLDTIRKISALPYGRTILGVSNVSFGLPKRENVNAAFLMLAMQEGLSAAIMNPNSPALMKAYHSFLALTDQDPNFEHYIRFAESLPEEGVAVKAAPTEKKGTGNEDTLFFSILRGRKERAAALTTELLKTKTGMELIEGELIPALDEVGKGFEKGTLFLPQLLMAADSAQSAFAVIREKLGKTTDAPKGRIILATVKNDIHDIGKNIVKVMLENYGYEVLDLGKDVAPELIAETCVKEKIRLVGLSALMTTTVPSMEETVKLLREAAPGTKIVVGGAVMTEEYARMIGADAYAKDAMETVRYADSVFN